MHLRHGLTVMLVFAATTAAACGEGPTATKVATTPASQRTEVRADRIVVRGDYAPDRHGPIMLQGRYRARFVQRGEDVDFTAEVPFTAHLEQAVASGPGKTVPLFRDAAATGATRVTAHGRFEVVVDFGDSPYEVVLEPWGAGGR